MLDYSVDVALIYKIEQKGFFEIIYKRSNDTCACDLMKIMHQCITFYENNVYFFFELVCGSKHVIHVKNNHGKVAHDIYLK